MSYSKIEINAIFTSCTTEEEVMESCARFRYLMIEADQEHLYYLQLVSVKRIQYLIFKAP